MYLAHNFYENSMSGANSYAKVIDNIGDVFDILHCVVFTQIA